MSNSRRNSINMNDADGVIAEKVDLLFEKRKAVREAALSSLHTILSLRYCGEQLEARQETLADGLERVIKDLQLEPTLLALRTTSLAILSLESGHKALFAKFNDLLQRLMEAIELSIRVEAINTLAIACFMSAIFDLEHETATTSTTITTLRDYAFSTRVEIPPDITRAILLLGGALPSRAVHQLLYAEHFYQISDLMDEKYDINIRIAAAKNVAALIEWERDFLQEEASSEEIEDFGSALDSVLAVLDDKTKFKNKVELKKQRSTLKSIIKYIEGGEVDEEVVSVRTTPVVLTTWTQIFRMERFRSIFGEGFMNHLEENKNVMHMFDYYVDAKAPIVSTMTKQQRRMSLSEASKAATKRRFSLRSIREQESVGYATE